MGRLRGSELQAFLECLRTVSTAADLETLRERLPRAITTMIPADIGNFFEIDRRGQRIAATLYPGEALSRDDLQRLTRYLHQSPLLGSYRRGEGSAVKISDFLTSAEFRRLPLYNEFFRGIGMEHQIAKGLPGVSGLITGISLYRSRRDFTESERLCLNLLRPHLNATYETMSRVNEMRREVVLLHHGFESIDRGLVVVDADGRVQLSTPMARRWMAQYFGRMPNGRLPEPLRRWLDYDEALLLGSGVPATPRAPLLAEREGRRLEVRIVFEGDRRLLVFDERGASPSAEDLAPLGLSRRQTEVLAWITGGKTNAEIGIILDMSERTVEKHVQHILDKLGVETRTAAAARALSVVR